MNLEKKRNALTKKLIQHPDFIRGSITSVCSTCNRAHCICRRESSLRAYRLTYKDAMQKTRTVYVRRENLPDIRKMIANYARLRKLIEQIVETNIEIFKNKSRR
jgi:hypothetical protein